MKKMKIFGSVAIAGLAALALGACDDNTNTASTSTPVEVTPDIDVEEAKATAVLAYAKTDAIEDLTTFASQALAIAQVESLEEVTAAITSGTAAINACTSTDAVKTATTTAIETIKTVIATRITSEKQLSEAKLSATTELVSAAMSPYPNTNTSQDRLDAIDVAIKAIDEATTEEATTKALNDASTALKAVFEAELEASYVKISSAEEFIAFRNDLMAAGTLEANYKLTSDIDLTGIDITAYNKNTYVYSGVFNGDGHVIKNSALHCSTAKTGFLFGTLKNALVMNIRFDSISVTGGTTESNAIVCGLIEGDTTIKNLEFISCSVKTSGNYAALVASRNTAEANITMQNITVKMSTYVKGEKYTGVLLGDMVAKTTANFIDCDITVKVENTGGQIAAVAGRVRGGVLNFKNIIVSADLDSSSNKAGIFFDGSSKAEVSFENILVKNTTLDAAKQSSIFDGQGSAAETTTYKNIYVVKDTVVTTLKEGTATLPSDVKEVEATALTQEWYKTTLGLDLDNTWEWDIDSVKIQNTSPNRPAEGATIKSISLVTDGVKTKYIQGEAFSSEGLVVKAKYSDGVEIALDSSKYTVDYSKFPTETGTGEITVAVKDNTSITAKYEIELIALLSIELGTVDLDTVFIKNDSFNHDDLVVIGTLSDGSKVNLTANASTEVQFATENMATAGTYTVTVKYDTLTPVTYDITVLETALTAEKATVKVDATHTGANGEIVNEVPTFKTIQAALDYIEASNLDASVVKTINIAQGAYTEKLTIVTPNLKLIGEGMAKTSIEYRSAAGMSTTDLSSTWSTDGSAVVTVKASATGFYSQGIMYENTFDYLNDKSVSELQALAMLCSADQSVFYQCGFTSYQDTLETKGTSATVGSRQYYDECYIAGAVDFIFGTNATAIFNKCEIKSLKRGEEQTNGGYITANQGCYNTAGTGTVTYGFVFIDCKLTAEDGVLKGSVSLGRPWRTDAVVAYINCEMGAHISVAEYPGNTQSRWETMNSTDPQDSRFYEYGTTGEGKITEAVVGGSILTAEEAAKYTVANIFAAQNGLVEYTSSWDALAALAALKGNN